MVGNDGRLKGGFDREVDGGHAGLPKMESLCRVDRRDIVGTAGTPPVGRVTSLIIV
jgi:hypothetical protein